MNAEAPNRRTRAAFICAGDPLEIRTWSGTPHHMLEALQREFDVVHVVRDPWPKWFTNLRRGLRWLSRRRIDIYWSFFWTRLAARRAVSEIVDSGCEVAITIAITPICAQLTQRVPTVFISDATQAAMVNYNPFHKALLPVLKRSAFALETRCIQDSLVSLFPSMWAYDSAIADHGGDPAHVHQVPWGANVLAKAFSKPEDRPHDEWRLLFVGVNWEGKGGEIAVEAVRQMRAAGRKVHLDVVGSAPSSPPPTIDGVAFHGFLNKHVPADAARLETLFRRSHLFILPTQFDAFPTVIAESASFALPAISYRTGGLPSNVENGVTGILLEPGAPPEDFAREISDLLNNPARYAAMCYAALELSRSRLNWATWAHRVREIVRRAMASDRGVKAVEHA
jgi:glycosyltransferase involved in cell wall biosynthesis